MGPPIDDDYEKPVCGECHYPDEALRTKKHYCGIGVDPNYPPPPIVPCTGPCRKDKFNWLYLLFLPFFGVIAFVIKKKYGRKA